MGPSDGDKGNGKPPAPLIKALSQYGGSLLPLIACVPSNSQYSLKPHKFILLWLIF